MKRLVRILAITAIVGAGAAAVPASALPGTWTQITSPKGPGQVIRNFQDETGTTPTITVSGTTSTDLVPGTNTINIYCFWAGDFKTLGPLNAAPLAITPSHTFSGSIPSDSELPACVLRAVPDTYTGIDSGTGDNSDYAGAFAGPTFFLGIFAETTPSVYGEAAVVVNERGIVETSSPDVGGVVFNIPQDNFSKLFGPAAQEPNLSLQSGNLVPGGSSTKSEIRVDGHDAYLPYTLFNNGWAADPALIPAISWSKSRLSNGMISSTETARISWCPGGTYPPTASSCNVTNTGLSLRRSYLSSSQGAVVTVRDTLFSNDGSSHTASLEYASSLSDQTNGEVGFMLPGQTSFHRQTPDTTLAGLPRGPHTIFMTTDMHAVDGASDRFDRGLTYSGKPVLYFATPTVYGLRYSRTVAANRSVGFAFGLESAFTMSTVKSLASAEQKALTPHLALTAPASKTSDNTPTIKGKVTNATNGLPAKVTITIGTKSKTVNVSPSTGAFQVTWTSLANGKHTAKAKATDPSGLVLTASRTFTCT
jgi:hypothetical protein